MSLALDDHDHSGASTPTWRRRQQGDEKRIERRARREAGPAVAEDESVRHFDEHGPYERQIRDEREPASQSADQNGLLIPRADGRHCAHVTSGLDEPSW
jgi:hypothetical protein